MSDSLRVRDYMKRNVATVQSDLPIMRAVFLLVDRDLSGVPVLDENGALVGILTERDCMQVALNAGYFDEPGSQVADYMTTDAQTAGIDDSLVDVAVRFRDSPFRRLPVLQDGQLAGIISRRDVLRALKKGAWFER